MTPHRTQITLLVAALVGLTATLAAGAERRDSYSASAYTLDGSELLYVERHVESWRENRLAERAVRYEDPSGALIAEKVVRYGEDAAAPSFEMIDYRTGLREGAEVGAEDVVLYSGPREESARERRLELPDVAVVDAGFDAFMRANFEAIMAGRSLEFDFAVPALTRFLRFELLAEGTVVYQGQEAVRVRMRPASAFLRLLVDPIDLTYSRSGRLLEFRGLANVLDERGDRYQARIVFAYPDSDPSLEPSAAQRVSAGR